MAQEMLYSWRGVGGCLVGVVVEGLGMGFPVLSCGFYGKKGMLIALMGRG